MKHCNKWLRWAFVEAAWVAMGCDSYCPGLSPYGVLFNEALRASQVATSAVETTSTD
jgi:hypothetical protein